MTTLDTRPILIVTDQTDHDHHDPALDATQVRGRDARALLGALMRPHVLTLVLLLGVALVENAARLSVPMLVRRGIDDGIPAVTHGGSARGLVLVVGALCAVVVVHGISRWLFLNRAGRLRQKVLLDLRRRLFRHFQRLDIAFHERYTTGRVVTRLTNDVEAVDDMLFAGFDCLITAALTPLGIAVLLVVLDWRLGLMCLAVFPILLVMGAWFRRHSARTYGEVRESTALVIMQFIETMSGIKALQAYRRESRAQVVFEDIAHQYRAILEKAFKLMAVFTPGVKVIGNVTTAVVILYGGSRVLGGDMTIGTFAAFLLYLRMFFEPLHEITHFFNAFQAATSALEKLAVALNRRPAIAEPEMPLARSGDARATDFASGTVIFDNVHFSYVPGRPVLSGLSVTIPAGQTVALVGRSGTGKSTIAKLLARFYDPTSGSITLDDVDLRDLAHTDLRRNVVLVAQEGFLFTGTIADNIRFGRPDATDAEVRDAAAAIGADLFIAALPEGYQTEVSNGGVALSAGQRQLIALSRAFVADSAVLIVDEVTSALDVPGERMVQHALETVLADRTALIIAHRLDVVDSADRVLVLGEHGEIVADGTPAELIHHGGQTPRRCGCGGRSAVPRAAQLQHQLPSHSRYVQGPQGNPMPR
ncbi:ABC transporter ATP-binding protein [Mycobacterium montefiorense]|uniref:ABC transporter ATP-binding protein n=1 Tax=Mycobacterium montefiorense TaxID=154654 RepID=UPI0021DCE062|nr:ABC transporter ATP-binding protein [Mycobacterium montefiorense]MCV7427440.1 ABC transporter ATP-binding protein [Mycobacterium montefiorense]GLE50866.1 ABC transporter ATP-binding protein [Mycobacterium montefiorense]